MKISDSPTIENKTTSNHFNIVNQNQLAGMNFDQRPASLTIGPQFITMSPPNGENSKYMAVAPPNGENPMKRKAQDHSQDQNVKKPSNDQFSAYFPQIDNNNNGNQQLIPKTPTYKLPTSCSEQIQITNQQIHHSFENFNGVIIKEEPSYPNIVFQNTTSPLNRNIQLRTSPVGQSTVTSQHHRGSSFQQTYDVINSSPQSSIGYPPSVQQLYGYSPHQQQGEFPGNTSPQQQGFPQQQGVQLQEQPSTSTGKKTRRKKVTAKRSRKSRTSTTSNDSRNVQQDDDDSWKICGVCNDKATGYHFNAMTCEGCKGFFRRSIKNAKKFVCLNNNECTIDKEQRKHCQACRLRLCFKIGMKRECIMTEKEIEEKRQLVMANRQKRAYRKWAPTKYPEGGREELKDLTKSFCESNVLPDGKVIRNGSIVKVDSSLAALSFTGYDEELYDLITKTMGSNFSDRGKPPKQQDGEEGDVCESHVTHFTDIMDFSIKQILKFCKTLKDLFDDLVLEDKVALLKSGCSELMFIKANYSYDKDRDRLTLGEDVSYTRESFIKGGMSPQYADRYLKFHRDLAMMKPDDEEMTLLSIISLFSADRCSNLKQRDLVLERCEYMATLLQSYCENKEGKQSSRLANLMQFLVRLRNLNQLCADSFKKVERNFGQVIRPLLKEMY